MFVHVDHTSSLERIQKGPKKEKDQNVVIGISVKIDSSMVRAGKVIGVAVLSRTRPEAATVLCWHYCYFQRCLV